MNQEKPSNASKPQLSDKAKLALGLGLVVVISVIGTVFISNNVNRSAVETMRDIGMASDACEERINDEFEATVISKSYDDISSRYELEKRQYVVYYRVTSRDATEEIDTIKTQLAKCIIEERRGYITSFEVIDT